MHDDLALQPEPAAPDATLILQELDDRLRLVQEQRPALAQVAPPRIRLYVLREIARVRAAEECLGNTQAAFRRGRALVHALERILKDLWAGKVHALKWTCKPITVLRDMGLHLPVQPDSWTQVAEIADEALAREWARQDLDEDGWADHPWLDPPPARAEALLREVQAILEQRMGPIQTGEWPGHDPRLLQDCGPELERAAVLLRWVRPCLEGQPAWRWGILMARLRFLASRMRGAFPGMERFLRPGLRLREPWAWKALRRELRHRPPRPGAGRQAVATWLSRACARHMLRNPEIAELLRLHGDTVLSLDAADLAEASDHRLRQRLADLQARLQRAGSARPQPPPAGSPPGELEDGAEAVVHLPAPASRELRAPATVLESTRGRRLLLIGNRQDSHLRSTLQRLLQAELEVAVCDWRRIQGVILRIRRRSVDLVLVATGFVGHDTWRAVSRACRQAGVPCVNANRARPASVLRALERDLGLVGKP